MVNEHDLLAVLSNLDELQAWTMFMHYSDAVKYQAIQSTNAGKPWHIDPPAFKDFLLSVGVECNYMELHHRASEALWWCTFLARVVGGTTEAAKSGFIKFVDVEAKVEEIFGGEEEE
jgi:hypothetical protein